MKAELKAGASFTWRSIMAGRWIPVPYGFKPYSEPMEGLDDLKVADLIDPDERDWQIHLLRELFTEHEVELIAKIPLSLGNPNDRLVWHFEKSGRYSGKSGYWTWKTLSIAPTHASSSSSIVGGQLARYWSALWRLQMPAKVQELECLLCGVELKTSVHLFKECTVVKEFWCNGPLKEVIPSVPNSSLKEWVWTVTDALDKDQQSLFFSSMWELWTERNKVFWNHTSFNSFFISQWVVQFLDEYKKVHGRVEVKGKRGQMKWECPPSGRLKINVDGAFNGSVGSGGIGVIVRDENGLGIAAVARPVKHAHSALHMKVEACRAGLQLEIHQGWANIDIESDYILLIAALEKEEEELSEVGPILEDCKVFLEVFQSAKV
ncbi:hypothetical protein ACLB2K_071951 [Fragaria x ananassa]